ncbi:hypothetical protein BGX23_001130, partial [Mortierella sp. AD031]
LLTTRQPLSESCSTIIKGDTKLIESADLGSVALDFMYSEKDYPTFVSDGLKLKFPEIPGLSIIEAKHDVVINYKGVDVASFLSPWAPSTMDGTILSTAIERVDVKVLSDNAFSELIAALLTKSEVPLVLKGTVDVNIFIATTDGGAPKNFIVAGLQLSSPVRLAGLNGLTENKFIDKGECVVYEGMYYFTAFFKFTNPSKLTMTIGGVEFDAFDGTGKKLTSPAAIDVFEIASGVNDVYLRLISNVNEPAGFLDRIDSSGDTVTLQGTARSSTNVFLAPALSQLKFTASYPALTKSSLPAADTPPQKPQPKPAA